MRYCPFKGGPCIGERCELYSLDGCGLNVSMALSCIADSLEDIARALEASNEQQEER